MLMGKIPIVGALKITVNHCCHSHSSKRKVHFKTFDNSSHCRDIILLLKKRKDHLTAWLNEYSIWWMDFCADYIHITKTHLVCVCLCDRVYVHTRFGCMCVCECLCLCMYVLYLLLWDSVNMLLCLELHNFLIYIGTTCIISVSFHSA